MVEGADGSLGGRNVQTKAVFKWLGTEEGPRGPVQWGSDLVLGKWD